MNIENYFMNLPIELINKIINYTDVLTFRYGKYINKIPKKDERYKMLSLIPKPIRVGCSKIVLKLINYSYDEPRGYLVEYVFSDDIKATTKFVKRITDCFDMEAYIEKSSVKYIYDIYSGWTTIVYYSM